MPVTIVANDFLSTNAYHSHGLDRTRTGVLWAMLYNETDLEMEFFYSTDDGTNWIPDPASKISNVNEGNFFIDVDDYAHVLLKSNDSPAVAKYYRGTPNAARTSWSWTIGLDISDGAAAASDTVLAHREGTGWLVHFFYTLSTDTLRYRNLPIASDGSFGTLSSSQFIDTGWHGFPSASADFRHTGDGKTAHATPHLYVAWQPTGISDVKFIKGVYSGGTYSFGTIRTLQATADANTSSPSLVFDGTRVMVAFVDPVGTIQVDERDEADTTTTARNPPAFSDGSVQSISLCYRPNGDLWLLASGNTSQDPKFVKFTRSSVTWGSWTVIETGGIQQTDRMFASGRTSEAMVMYELDSTPDQVRFERFSVDLNVEATLQGVGSVSPDASLGIVADANLRGVAAISPTGNIAHGPTVTLQGVGTLDPQPTFIPKLDFTVHDLYLDDGKNVYACIVHEDDQIKGATNANPIRAEKQDVGQNPLEQRPEFGDHFAQGDFSHGSDQDYYHHTGRDERKYLTSEGFDISEPGVLRHLHDVAETLNSTTAGHITQADGVLFAADGTVVKRHDGLLPGQWNFEDPHASEGSVTVLDLTSRGDELFAALGVNGVHIRSSSSAWTHFKPDNSTNLEVGSATGVAWLKDRLMVIGTAGREIFEVVADSTPTALKTLPEGWTFVSVFEAGAFLYAPTVNADAGLSRVHIFGLNDAGSTLEDKGSVPIPRGELIYAGIGDPGGIFLGGGRKTVEGGYDPVFYQAIQGDNGFLQLLKIAQGEGAQALDCSVRAFEALGDAIVFSWSVGSGAPTGARTGLAWYHLGRQAFNFHLRKTVATASMVTDIIFHAGILVFTVDGDGIYYEDTTRFVSEAYLISSIADWGTAGLKSWDQSEVSHKALPSTASVQLQYTTKHPDEGNWRTALTSSTAGALGAAGRLSDIVSRLFAVKLVSRAATDLVSAPELQSFSVRSNPTRSTPEYVLTRFIRLVAKDRKDGRGSVVYVDPVTRRIAIQQLLDSWVTVYEPGITWTAFVKDVSDAEPAEPFLSGTEGEPLKEAYLVRIDMIATGEAA